METTTNQFEEIKKAVAALVSEWMKYKHAGFLWGHSPYKELKWVQHMPIQFGIECGLRHIGKRLKKYERHFILIEMAAQPEARERLRRLWDGEI